MPLPLKSLFGLCLSLLLVGAAFATDEPVSVPGTPESIGPSADYEYGYDVAWSPFQLGFLDVYQLFAFKVPIRGLSLGVLSTWDRAVDGVAMAPIYNSATAHRGATLAGVCNKADAHQGVAVAGIVNKAGRQEGIALGGLCNVADARRGLALAGVANWTEEPGAAGARSVGIFAAGLANVDHNPSAGGHVTLGMNVLDRFSGVSLAGLTNYLSTGRGIQVAGLYNKADQMSGLRIAGLANDSDSTATATTRTVQLAGLTNITTSNQRGILACLFYNWTEETNTGLQLAAFNRAKATRGLQVGLFNDSTKLHGVQIGLLNFSGKKMRLPLINVGMAAGK